MKLTHAYRAIADLTAMIGRWLQPVLLLVLRLWWGWSFFVTARGKLLHLDQTTEFFASLSIPMPKANALVAGSVECCGGLLLMVGLGTRLAAIPLIFTLAVAYVTAEREALLAIFSEPDKFTSATPFLFLLAVLVVFAFGPGNLSVDHWLELRRRRRLESPVDPSRAQSSLVSGHSKG